MPIHSTSSVLLERCWRNLPGSTEQREAKRADAGPKNHFLFLVHTQCGSRSKLHWRPNLPWVRESEFGADELAKVGP